MSLQDRFVSFSITRPRTVTVIMIVATLLLSALMVRLQVDTDPENMLSEKEEVRIFHHLTKKKFGLHDVIVVGIVNETDEHGVFNPETLSRVDALTRFAATLADPNDPTRRVVTRDVIAPGTVDAIVQDGPGQVRFQWLMEKPPATLEQALEIKKLAMDNPLLAGTLVSEDGRALAIYLPITAKDFAYTVREKLLQQIATFPQSNDQFHITGLPVAEDTFGVEMFIQMAISAPLAMMAIFFLMLFFFRTLNLIIAPMIVAMASVLCTMGLLIGTGNTVHIMSSMIPIFLMPIAVVDSIHILSEFFDTYQKTKDRKATITGVLRHLFAPMLYTSLTSAAGFASLALTPIPPVQVFGLFVAFGILLAWLLTILFVPAYVMMLPEKSLENFGARDSHAGESSSFMARRLRWIGGFTSRQAKPILALALGALAVAVWGISQIRINDNPVKWFKKSHPIRVADKVLNRHFGGTYEAYLVLESAWQAPGKNDAAAMIQKEITALALPDEVGQKASELLQLAAAAAADPEALWAETRAAFQQAMDQAPDATYDAWADVADTVERVRTRGEVFKDPAMLRYVEQLQKFLADRHVVGKSNSVADVVKKVHTELFSSDPKKFSVPETRQGVAQCLISFQNSHKPNDLWHLVTPDYTAANIWLQLKSGDNTEMEQVVAAVDGYMQDNPPPTPVVHKWAGLTYINVVWQDKMVWGMLQSFLSSFAVVYIMMAVLFRSPLWGLLAMVPLTVTIALIYGLIGIMGKDYDMPVAVLSALTLGLAVDFAIHFLERSREAYKRAGSWNKAVEEMFAEPARAITRNVIVIAVGFTPLLLAPLVPYQTVGFFLASIMAVSGLATMFLLPALMTVLEKWLFRAQKTHTGEAS